MLNFCTLFDINYFSQGLAMYESLKNNCKNDFMLYIFAFCDESHKKLKELNLDSATIISLKELEQGIPALLEAKKDRTKGEYCWTCGSASILYCIKTFNLNQCTYLDADIYFYSDPKILLDEMGEKSILITEHRYTPRYDQTETSGKYCVQFVSFKNDENGMKALNWWVDSCIDWCYARIEDGKFGDQKYLDDWTQRFTGVHVLKHLGGGVAPWNVQQYDLKIKNNQKYIQEKNKKECYPIVFYHFHNLKVDNKGYFSRDSYAYYSIDDAFKKELYLPYMKKLSENSKKFSLGNIKSKFSPPKFIKFKFGKNGYLELLGKKII